MHLHNNGNIQTNPKGIWKINIGHSGHALNSEFNLTKEEIKGLAQLKKDKDRLMLTAGKGVAIAFMDKEDYIQKADSLLV